MDIQWTDNDQAVTIDGTEYEIAFSKNADTTFILMILYYPNGDIKSRTVIAFYSGQPNRYDTLHYILYPSISAYYQA